MTQGKWKCSECGGGGDDGTCIWCGGTGRPSYQQAFMLGRHYGQWEHGGIERDHWVGGLLRILSSYGNTDALNAAFHGDVKFSKLLRMAKEGSVEAIMAIVHRMRSFGSKEDLDALFIDDNVSYYIDEISPNR